MEIHLKVAANSGWYPRHSHTWVYVRMHSDADTSEPIPNYLHSFVVLVPFGF